MTSRRASGTADEATTFEQSRRRLTGLAYRMLGSLAEAEDVVQEAYLRWQGCDRSHVTNPPAYLTKTVARLCLDHMKSARARRETYVGPWLPEPLLDGAMFEAGDADDEADDLSIALLLTLERLSPLERAAFLLHDVFGAGFAEIADALGRTEPACRQLAARGRAPVREDRPRFKASPDEGRRLADAFHAAIVSGDIERLARTLATDAVLYSDGGGKRPAALNPIVGRDKILRLFAALLRKQDAGGGLKARFAEINGLPGFVIADTDGALQTLALDIRQGQIAALYLMANPDKLRHVRNGMD
jgi:RNA polymerase sigma-70 factor (ECF subfamily)